MKKGDTVKVITGDHKGKTAVIVAAYPSKMAVALEGIGLVKRNIKPSQTNPRGGTKEVHVPIDVSKVALVESQKKAPATAKKGSKK